MFIFTLWDVGAIIFFLVCVVICLKTWIEANINARQYERKKEPKPEPKKATPRPAGALDLLGIIIFIAICLIVSALSKK